MKRTLALISPTRRKDALFGSVLDGILQLRKEGDEIDFKVSTAYENDSDTQANVLSRSEFVTYAKSADAIILFWGKDVTDFELADEIDRYDVTVFIDGSEVGKNRRFDTEIQKKILEGSYDGQGKIDARMLEKCRAYFRREKPYPGGVTPLPFGINRKYVAYSPSVEKDIDFCCVFGQDEYPLMRRHVRELLEVFCKKNGFSCHTTKTNSPSEFYSILARSKVGVSVGGGGYDTYRFWEILGNNCLLLTETIDIYEPNSKRLDYSRIRQFSNLYDFETQLSEIGAFLRNGYSQKEMEQEYTSILESHSSKSRALEVLNVVELMKK